MRPWQRRAGFQSQTAGGLASFTAFLPFGIALSLTVYQYPDHFLASPKTHSPMKPSWTHPYLLGSQALFTSLISHEGPSYSAPSFVHVHMASLSSCGVRSVHEALCWTLMLIISNPHSKMHSKYWPHFTDKETENE